MQQLPRTQLCRGLRGGFVTKQILQIGSGDVHHHPNNWQRVSTRPWSFWPQQYLLTPGACGSACLAAVLRGFVLRPAGNQTWKEDAVRMRPHNKPLPWPKAWSMRAWLCCPLIVFVNYSCFPSPGQGSFLCAVRTSDRSLTYVGKELKWKSHSKP